MDLKAILLKGLIVEKYLENFHDGNEIQQREVCEKFEQVWGAEKGNYFLYKYENAESLILDLNEEDLAMFIEKF